jgi:L-seryl-tRNA(Ser) seleniumtransferase
MKRNPLYRAFRPDKTTVAALEATLESFVAGNPLEEIPVLRMLSMPPARIRSRADALARGLLERAADRIEIRVEEGVSRAGGGSAPMEDLPTFPVALRPRGGTVEAFEEALRLGRPPVIARVHEGWLLVDLRTVPAGAEAALAEALLNAAP